MLSVVIEKVLTKKAINCVEELATEIWTEHFTPIIGESQVKYMLEKFQSADAISAQINDGAEYYLVKVFNEWAGYFGLIPDTKHKKIMLSKIYVKNSARGKGVGQSILDYVEGQCLSREYSSLWLTVNKFNDNPIAWYIHHNFLIVDEVKKDIGGGFFMDDYIMEKKIILE